MRRILYLIVVLFLLSVNGLSVVGRSGQIGIWGGEHVQMQVTPSGATIEFDCAHGTISQKIIPDRSGRFVVNGVYVPEHGGPVRTNEQPVNVPVTFTGQVRGQSMSLTMKRRDTRKRMGVFALSYGQEGELVKCR